MIKYKPHQGDKSNRFYKNYRGKMLYVNVFCDVCQGDFFDNGLWCLPSGYDLHYCM